MQERLDSHESKIAKMEKTLERIVPIIEQNQQRHERTLFWIKLNTCLFVASIFIKLFYLKV